MALRKAVLIDRDGTLIRDFGYLKDPADVELLPGAAEALQKLQAMGFELAVVSNQSGIARGLLTVRDLLGVTAKLDSRLRDGGIAIRKYYYCPHGPEAGCSCRKPSPGMVRDALFELGVLPEHSYMVGDKSTDVIAGQRAGVTGVLIQSKCVHKPTGTLTFAGLLEFAQSLEG